MNRVLLTFLILAGSIPAAFADHITGGEVYYTYTGNSGGNYEYDITVRLFMRCNSGRQFNNPSIISIFDRLTGARVKDYSVAISSTETLNLVNDDPCISNPPVVCYEVAYYKFHASLPASSGFTITAHVMFRIDGMNNLVSNYDRVGATYVGEIPASENAAAENNSARFIGDDLVVICSQNFFTYSFAASDADGDELRYSFCQAYQTTGGGGFGGFGDIEPPPPPPYQSVPYGNGYNGSIPLGNNVTIDPETGMISGVAPGEGTYVVTVCVEEIRNGTVIATQHKDIQIKIASCAITGAALPEDYMLCGESTTLNVKNLSNSPLVKSFNWDFLDGKGNIVFSSTEPQVSHTFSDTGTYLIKLVINQDQQCADSATALALVYPGFAPDFNTSGPCIVRPTRFIDATTSLYGTVSAWEWDFGDDVSGNDMSNEQSPSYQYYLRGDKLIRLVAENTFGCKDTITKVIGIYDKPPINLAFRDTLICPPDALRLSAIGTGIFTWGPSELISGPATATPLVSPVATTTYYVALEDDGCFNTDSLTVRVVDRVSLEMMGDPLICEGDSIQLTGATDGLRFEWSPANSLNNPALKTPVAKPAAITTYEVTASISSCSVTGEVTVTPVPYPQVNAGPDTTVCFNTIAPLHASTNGSSFNWAPASSLSEPNTLHPVARPEASTSYIIYAFDNKGCPKPGMDTVLVRVQPEIVPFAGRDTVVVINQPLQLQASGGDLYEWIPSIGLSATNIANPVARYTSSPAEGYYMYKVRVSNETGCIDSALVQVKVFSTLPELYVPSAFTPNGDGLNDYFRPVAAGVTNISAFRVYNRWGQQVYESPLNHSLGWNGSYAGKPLPSDTYVWMIRALDYTGKQMVRKGTVILLR